MAESSDRKVKFQLDFSSNVDTINQTRTSLKQLGAQIISLVKTTETLTKNTNKLITAQNVMNQTFGKSVDSVNSYIESLSNMTGISTVDIAQKTALFGQMATSLGMDSEMASEFSQSLDDLSAKLALLYNTDFNSMAKAMLDAIKGESSTLTTLTGNVLKGSASLQNTLNELGIDLVASDLTGANKAMLQYITIARQVTTTNEDFSEITNSVAWQQQVLKQQVKELATAIGNLLYPVLEAVLPVLNGIIIAFTTLIKMLASLLGISTKTTSSVSASASAYSDYADSIAKASSTASKSLRSFDKLNNIKTPTSTSTTGSIGSISPELLAEYNKLQQDMLDIHNKAQDIADSILKWLGFSQDIDGNWKFKSVTLGTIIGLLVGGGGLIWALKKIWNIFKAFKNLGTGGLAGLLGLTGATKTATSGIPSIKTVLTGIADLALIVVALTVLVEAYGKLSRQDGFSELVTDGITQLVDLFTGLSKIIIPLAGLSLIVAGLGVAGFGTVAQGILGLAGIIDVLGLVVYSIGMLEQKYQISEVLSVGGDVLIGFFEILGGCAGAIVKGFVNLSTTGLADVGTNLSLFMENASPFFEGAENIDADTMLGVKYLAEALVTLIKGDVYDFWFGNPFKSNKTLLVDFGKQLAEFAPYFADYADIVKGLDADVVINSANAAKSLAEFASEIPNSGGLAGLIAGENDLADFGKMLPAFGANLKSYADNVTGLDADVVTNSTACAKSISEFASNLPNSGGLAGWLAGNNDLDDFGEMLPSFGKNLKQYADNVTGLDADVVENSTNCAKSISTLAKNLPNSGGIVSWFTGDNSIDKFGEKLKTFGLYFHDYYIAIQNIGVEKLNSVTTGIKGLVDISSTIKNKGLSSTLNDFAKNLSSSSNLFNSFFSKTNATTIGTDFGTALGNAIATALKKVKYPSLKITESGSTTALSNYKISAYKEGGFPEDGLFFANHNELVGKFANGKTAVANNEQILKGIENGVASGMQKALSSSNIGGNNTFYVKAQFGDEEITDWQVAQAKKRDRQYGF